MKGADRCAAPCRFWLQLTTVGSSPREIGQCRRHPPRFDGAMYRHGVRQEGAEGGSAMLWGTSYPMTAEDDWCGEFERDIAEGPR